MAKGTDLAGLLRETLFFSWARIVALASFLLASLGFLDRAFNNKHADIILFIHVLVFLVGTVALFIYYFIRIKKSRVNVDLFDKELKLIIGDFQNNMEKVFIEKQTKGAKMDDFVFVMGMDLSGKLDIVSEKGIIFYVVKYLNENYICLNSQSELPSDYIQEQIEDYIKNNKGKIDKLIQRLKEDDSDYKPEYRLPYELCIPVRLEIKPKTVIKGLDINKTIVCNLLLVANTGKTDSNNKNTKELLAGKKYANRIVPAVFETLSSEYTHYSEVMIGIIGSNKVNQTYQIILSQIINQYARICKLGECGECSVESLYISIRKEDFGKKITLAQIERYVRNCAKFYK